MQIQVLIADDAMFMRKVIRKNLEGCGITDTIEAANGVEAVERYKECSPDLVLLDITMPEKSGIQALEEILAIDPGARVIMCSAVGQQSMIVNALEKGAVDFIVKPFEKDEFESTVLRAVRQLEE